jgi:hypothetical protein
MARTPENEVTEEEVEEEVEEEDIPSPATVRKHHNLPPILLFGQYARESQQSNEEPTQTESPIILLAPNSAKSTETQETISTIPLSPTSKPTSPITILSRSEPPTLAVPTPPSRPPILSFATESESGQEPFETADEFISETPSPEETDNESNTYPNSLLVPSDKTPKQPPTPNPILLDPIISLDPWLSNPTVDTASSTSSTSSLDISDEESLSEPVFSPLAQWQESPVIGSILPGSLYPGYSAVERPRTPSSVESESSWLAQKDIQSAVRKSFHGGSPRRTPPIILESSVLPSFVVMSPGKIDGVNVAAMNTKGWVRGGVDYVGEGYGDDEFDGVEGFDERVRQGSMARAVEVKRGVEGVQGVVPRVSGESPYRGRTGAIVLL